MVIRTDRMGDVILSLPVLTALKRTFSKLTMMVRPYAYDLVSGHPHLDSIIFDDEGGAHKGIIGFLHLVKIIKKLKFDTAIILHPTFRLVLLTFLSGIPQRVGTAFRLYSFLLNKKVYHHRKRSRKHELNLNLEVIKAIGIDIDTIQFNFFIPSEAKDQISQLLDLNKNEKQPVIVLHPGSGGSARDWSPQKFGQLAQQLKRELDAFIVLTGTFSEVRLVDKVETIAGTKLLRLDGQLKIKELAALLHAADLLIANSTGPLHLAVAVGTKVIGLYCPIEPCLPDRWGPYDIQTMSYQTDSVIMPDMTACKKCIGKDCGLWDCMENIPVSEVFNLARKKLMIDDDHFMKHRHMKKV